MPRSQRLEPAAGFSVDPASTGASGATTLPATSAPGSVCIERGWLARQRAGRRGFREIFGVQLAAPEVWKQRRPYLHT